MGKTGFGGTITAGIFLKHFVEKGMEKDKKNITD